SELETSTAARVARPSTSSGRAELETLTAARGRAESETLNAARGELVEPRDDAEPHASRGLELGLMAFSVLVALIGIALAYKFYVTSPEISERLAEDWPTAHRTLSNKYYVDEMYDATIISGTFASGRGLWAFDRRVVDGAV